MNPGNICRRGSGLSFVSDENICPGRDIPADKVIAETPLELVSHLVEEFLVVGLAVGIFQIPKPDAALIGGTLTDIQVEIFLTFLARFPFDRKRTKILPRNRVIKLPHAASNVGAQAKFSHKSPLELKGTEKYSH